MEGRKNRKNASATLRKEKDVINTLGLTADVHSFFTKNWSANSGIDLYSDKVNSQREDINTNTSASVANRGLYPNASVYGNYSLYTLHHFRFNRFMIEAGGRYNYYSIGINDANLGKISIKPDALVFQAGAGYKISNVFNLL